VKLYLSVEKSSVTGATEAAADSGTVVSATVLSAAVASVAELSAAVSSSGVLFTGVVFFTVRKNLVNCLSVNKNNQQGKLDRMLIRKYSRREGGGLATVRVK
jgi:phosphate/sulfate permease